jgi:hypothetical protein
MAATVISLLHGGRDPLTVFNLSAPQPAAAASVKRGELPLSVARQRRRGFRAESVDCSRDSAIESSSRESMPLR